MRHSDEAGGRGQEWAKDLFYTIVPEAENRPAVNSPRVTQESRITMSDTFHFVAKRPDMPPHNRFHHQQYTSAVPTSSYRLIAEPVAVDPDSADFADRMVQACAVCREVPLRAVYLIHGTFTGNDPLGMLTELQRFSPRWSERLRSITKGAVDVLIGETGNFTQQYAAAFAAGLKASTGRDIPVQRFNWSSQNNHIARADGAVRLLRSLAHLAETLRYDNGLEGARVLLWAHSHGGNALAIMTNLLAAGPQDRQAFFDAARGFFTRDWSSKSDMPAWEEVEDLLRDASHPLYKLQLDMVTLGTPIRYGWDSHGYAKLLHFVNHRPQPEHAEYRTGSPLRPLRLVCATEGDYVQQIGIAGTNIPPLPLAVRTFLADRRLRKVLERDLTWEWLPTKFARGKRVSDEATTLLVDYHDGGLNPLHLFGHAAYTRRQWLPFQLEQTCQEFYAGS